MFSLLFGIPVMVVMIFNMVRKSSVTCVSDSDDSVTSDPSTVTMSVVTSAESTDTCHTQIMLMPGLSLENVLLFALCTPCQVGCSVLTTSC